MMSFLLGLTVFLFVGGVFGQFVNDRTLNPSREVARTQVRTKTGQCSLLGFDYNIVTRLVGVVPTDFVDRTNFVRRVGSRSIIMPCAPGTLFSVEPNMCSCTVADTTINQVQNFENRCARITGDFQADLNFQNLRIDNSGANVQVSTDIQRPSSFVFSGTLNCESTGSNTPVSLPYYDNNNIARNSFDVTIGFSVPANADNGIYKIISNSPCSVSGEIDEPSFELSYVEQVGSKSIVLNLRVQSSYAERNVGTETAYSVTCTLGTINRASTVTAINFNEADATNFVRIIGTLNSLGGASISVGNSQIPQSSFNTDNIPSTGFCVTSSTSGTLPRRVSGGLVLAERNCNLMFAQAPVNPANPSNAMCVYQFTMTTDC